MMANFNILEDKKNLRKLRIIKRIVQYSDIYKIEDLEKLSLEQLNLLQSSTLVELRVIIKYKKRS